MRRIAAIVLLAVACAKAEQAADTAAATSAATSGPAALSLADVAGTWDVKGMAADRDTVLLTYEMTATADTTGWSTKLPNGESPAVRVISVAGDSVITESGPFASVLRKGQQVSIHQISRLRDGKLIGVMHARYANGDTATLRTEATKRP